MFDYRHAPRRPATFLPALCSAGHHSRPLPAIGLRSGVGEGADRPCEGVQSAQHRQIRALIAKAREKELRAARRTATTSEAPVASLRSVVQHITAILRASCCPG